MKDDTNWQLKRSMTPLQFRRAAMALGMTLAGAGRFVGCSPRTLRRWVKGEAIIPAAVVLLLNGMIAHGETPIVPRWERP